MKTAKKTKRNATGMDEKAKAEWRAAKSAQLDGRVAALKKLAASPDPKAKKPARSFPPPADAPTAATTAPVAEVAATAPDGPTPEVAASGAATPDAAPASDGHAPAAAGGQQQEGGEQGGQKKRVRKAPGERKPREGGCLNIAAKLLAEATEPMTTKALIEAMAAKGLWTSPGGKTPSATLYAGILREIRDKGDAARFRKMDRGLFAARTPATAKN